MPGRRNAAAARMQVAPDRGPNIEPIGAGDWIRMLLYSYPGWGKTSVEGTAALSGRTLIIRSSMDLMPARILNIPNLDQVVCDTHEAMDEILDYCRMTQDFPYLWVWWDNISTAQDVLLDDIWEATYAEKPGRNYLLDKETGLSTGKPNLTPTSGLDRGEYGRNADRIQRWVRHMVGCKRFHFGIGAHPALMAHPVNDEGGEILGPWVQVKNMPSKIAGYCNMVGFLNLMEEDDQQWRRLQFKENGRFYAKDQYDAFLPNGFIDITEKTAPTIPRIMAAVEKARGKGLGDQTGRTPTTAARGRRGAAGGTR